MMIKIPLLLGALLGFIALDSVSALVRPCCDPLEEPGDSCFEGYACCPNGNWSCSIGDGMTFPCGELGSLINPDGLICGENQDPPCCDRSNEPGFKDNPICSDGHACCPDGTWSCSIGDGNTFPCGDSGNLLNPQGLVCGEFVVITGIPLEDKCCDQSSFPYCLLGSAACCPGGEWSCPNGDTDIYQCNGETVVSPQGTICGKLGACCDPLQEPGVNGNNIGREGYACCPDGTWAFSIGDGKTFYCGESIGTVESPQGEICPEPECCDQNAIPSCIYGGSAKCCPQGVWSCPLPGQASTYSCGRNGVLEDPTGPVCKSPTCCPSESYPYCLLGTAKCCPGGNWACPDGDTDIYDCGDGIPLLSEGPICTSPSEPEELWEYTEPVWWPDMKKKMGKKLSKCENLQFPPSNGTKCGKKDKTCLFETQDCEGMPYPMTTCFCDTSSYKKKKGSRRKRHRSGSRGGWVCEPMECPNAA